jgi:hypothetical protein
MSTVGTGALGVSEVYLRFATIAADEDLRQYSPEGLPARWIRIGGPGDLVVERPDGTEVTLAGMLAGEVHMGAVKVIKAATTAGELVVYW